MSNIKLVPIDARHAADCAREGRAAGLGYYVTVNARVADYPRVKWCADMLRDMCAEFPGFLTDEEVNGADLVDFLAEYTDELRQLCEGK